jgi:hypothetical protein
MPTKKKKEVAKADNVDWNKYDLLVSNGVDPEDAVNEAKVA